MAVQGSEQPLLGHTAAAAPAPEPGNRGCRGAAARASRSEPARAIASRTQQPGGAQGPGAAAGPSADGSGVTLLRGNELRRDRRSPRCAPGVRRSAATARTPSVARHPARQRRRTGFCGEKIMSHFDEMTGLLYLEGQLEAETETEVSTHLSSCAECRSLLQALQKESIWLKEALAGENELIP